MLLGIISIMKIKAFLCLFYVRVIMHMQYMGTVTDSWALKKENFKHKSYWEKNN